LTTSVETLALDLSSDGKRIVGMSLSSNATGPHPVEAFGWTRPSCGPAFWNCSHHGQILGGLGGMFGFGIPLTGTSQSESAADGISPQGDIVVGYSNDGVNNARAVYWMPAWCLEAQVLDRLLPSHQTARAFDVSDIPSVVGDAVIVGYSTSANQHPQREAGAKAVYWLAGTSPTPNELPLPGTFTAESSEATCLAPDAEVLAGTLYQLSSDTRRACAWWFESAATGYQPLLLEDLPGGAESCQAHDLGGPSHKMRIVGWGTTSSGKRPCTWPRASGSSLVPFGSPTELPVLGDTVEGAAFAVNGDGSVIAGYLFDGNEAYAVRWLRTGSGPNAPFGAPQKVSDLIASKAIPGSTGWQLRWVTKLSKDGRTMIGDGANPAGDTEGWVAHVPVP